MLFTGDAPELGSGQLVPVGYYSEFQFRPVSSGQFRFQPELLNLVLVHPYYSLEGIFYNIHFILFIFRRSGSFVIDGEHDIDKGSH